MTANGSPYVLITIPISHYCEKARWALDRVGVAYRERPHLQIFHIVAARRAGGRSMVPVLVRGDRVWPDSADILELADGKAPPERRLYPDDPVLAAEARSLEREFDMRLGPQGRGWMYHQVRGRREIATGYAGTGVPSWERGALRVAYPAITRMIERCLEITPEAAAASEREVRKVFDEVAARLADGRPYLVGDGFTAADLTFAALASPVLVPPEYSVPLPQPAELPAAMAATVRELRQHPAGAHALAMFRKERYALAA